LVSFANTYVKPHGARKTPSPEIVVDSGNWP
jgi:hypothetical protein